MSRTFLSFPVSAEEGAGRAARLEGLRQAVKELRRWTFIGADAHIKVGVLALARRDAAADPSYDREARRSCDDAEYIVKMLNGTDGTSARNYWLELEQAVTECDVISLYRGAYGNLMYRTLIYFGSSREIASPSFTEHAYVGGSQNQSPEGLVSRVAYAAARASSRLSRAELGPTRQPALSRVTTPVASTRCSARSGFASPRAKGEEAHHAPAVPIRTRNRAAASAIRSAPPTSTSKAAGRPSGARSYSSRSRDRRRIGTDQRTEVQYDRGYGLERGSRADRRPMVPVRRRSAFALRHMYPASRRPSGGFVHSRTPVESGDDRQRRPGA